MKSPEYEQYFGTQGVLNKLPDCNKHLNLGYESWVLIIGQFHCMVEITVCVCTYNMYSSSISL